MRRELRSLGVTGVVTASYIDRSELDPWLDLAKPQPAGCAGRCASTPGQGHRCRSRGQSLHIPDRELARLHRHPGRNEWLASLGIRQSRYFGRVKTRFQLYLAATVANPTLVLGKSSCRAVLVAAQKATASSSMLSSLLSPMLRPIWALSGSDNYGPWSCSRRLYRRNPSTQPGLSGPVYRRVRLG